jgi:hypothetical protein
MIDKVKSEAVENRLRALLSLIIARADIPGCNELAHQVDGTHVSAGAVTMLELRVDAGLSQSSCPDGPIVIPAIVNGDDGLPMGELLLWVRNGYIDSLEFSWWSDEPPVELPLLQHVHFGH